MMNRSLAMMVAVLVVSTGCSKKEDASTSGASASATAPASTVAKADNCVEGAYKDPAGMYCVKAPAGFTPPKATKKSDTDSEDRFDTDGNSDFTIKYWTPSASYAFKFEDIKKQDLVETDILKNVSHEDFADGNGFYSVRHETVKGTTGNIFANSVVKRGAMLITCESSTDEAKPLNPPDACKTLRAM
ncbi:hypothetical protein BH09MYX1_BH09MYX1_13730 [soil metagenome]